MAAIGIRDGMAWDGARRDWDDAGPRPLAWTAWYPAMAGTGAPVSAEGQFFESGAVSRDADHEAGGALPVVLLSHGTGGSPQSLGWLARFLAGHGHVVIGAHHHGNTAREPYRPEGFLAWWERAPDLSALLTELAAHGPFAGRLDLDRVSAVGFSLGCYAVLSLGGARGAMTRYDAWARAAGITAAGPREMPDAAAHLPRLLDQSRSFQASWSRQGDDVADRRIRSIVAIAAPPPLRAFSPESLAGIGVPTLLVTGDADAEAPSAFGANWLRAENPGFSHVSMGAEVGHYTFLERANEPVPEEMAFLFADPPALDRRVMHQACAEVVLSALA
ncbi:alpha/beta hydrolase family protein [Devosia sediminis]|uniref:Dienelactone hydrolase n=1 Tax=Devosia sediminis TaxID=2798801 RepID=A0A934J1A9_9HYPH|nr:dienelactone hydrolase [Devosia sediminis]MBJ3785804.1 dienelactone hydrolase [Devosia sediminis]